jgi:hypothetical protein
MGGQDDLSIFIAVPEEHRPLRTHRHGWEDNIKMNLEVGYEYVGWIHRDQDRDKEWTCVNTTVNTPGV